MHSCSLGQLFHSGENASGTTVASIQVGSVSKTFVHGSVISPYCNSVKTAPGLLWRPPGCVLDTGGSPKGPSFGPGNTGIGGNEGQRRPKVLATRRSRTSLADTWQPGRRGRNLSGVYELAEGPPRGRRRSKTSGNDEESRETTVGPLKMGQGAK